MPDLQYSITVAARKTGLSPHVIRVWEKRYGAVVPRRSATKRRLYSEAEVERLGLLRDAISTGHRIGNIATLSVEQLRRLVGELPPRPGAPQRVAVDGDARTPLGEIEHCLEAVGRMNAKDMEEALGGALVRLGHQGLLQKIVGPLASRVGELWQQGELTAAHEHFATGVIRSFLALASRPYASGSAAPCLVMGTPAGQLHELGALIAGSLASNLGWRVAYLGASLPAAELAGAVRENGASALGLSIVYPPDDPQLSQELVTLRRFLEPGVPILVSGRCAESYREVLVKIDARVVTDLEDFAQSLDAIREQQRSRRTGMFHAS